MTTVACVKAGDKYGPEFVGKLYRACQKHGLAGYRFVCFTDDPSGLPEGVEPLPLHPVPHGWWHKLHLFNWRENGINDRILYMDLDMVAVGDLHRFAEYDGPFATAAGMAKPTLVRTSPRGPMRPQHAPGCLSSTVMSIPVGFGQEVWDNFACVPEYHMLESRFAHLGDQRFIQEILGNERAKFQEIWPGSVVSYKFQCRGRGGPPAGASLVSFHGKPDPDEVFEEWVLECWAKI